MELLEQTIIALVVVVVVIVFMHIRSNRKFHQENIREAYLDALEDEQSDEDRRAAISDGVSGVVNSPGWYTDPDGSHETYFDGHRWTTTRERGLPGQTPEDVPPTV